MTVNELSVLLSAEVINLPDGDREVTGAYIGDLLSWVMGRAQAGDAWITIMTNVNIVAVASLADTACIILAEGVELEENALAAAVQREINILKTDKTAYEAAKVLAKAEI